MSVIFPKFAKTFKRSIKSEKKKRQLPITNNRFTMFFSLTRFEIALPTIIEIITAYTTQTTSISTPPKSNIGASVMKSTEGKKIIAPIIKSMSLNLLKKQYATK